MIKLRFALTLLMVLLLFLLNISEVIGSTFEHINKSHDPLDKSDVRNGSFVYEAYFPDHQNLKRQEQLFRSEPIAHHLWRNIHNSHKTRSSYISRNSHGYQPPLPKTLDNYSGSGNQPSIESEKQFYRYVTNTASNRLINTIGGKSEKLFDHTAITSKLPDHGDVTAKTYFNCHKLDDPPIYKKTFHKTVPKVHTSQVNTHDRSIESATTEENIYQPRSQVIQYKFNSPYKLLGRIGKWNSSKGVYGNHVIENDNDISNRYQHHSIESGQKHKIRHHHGELRRPFF